MAEVVPGRGIKSSPSAPTLIKRMTRKNIAAAFGAFAAFLLLVGFFDLQNG